MVAINSKELKRRTDQQEEFGERLVARGRSDIEIQDLRTIQGQSQR